jgi:hypothetical protein
MATRKKPISSKINFYYDFESTWCTTARQFIFAKLRLLFTTKFKMRIDRSAFVIIHH